MTLRHRLLTFAVATVILGTGEAAHAADPTTADCLAASDASLRLGNEHKLLAERAQLLVCAAATCPEEIRKECVSRVDEVNAHIPTLIFWAKDATGADLSAVKVTMDGTRLTERLEGTALSTDPGEHSFRFEAAGLPPITRTFMILQAQKDRRELITFGAPVAVGSAASSAPAAASGAGLGTQKVLAIAAAGVGVVGLGLGTAFGLVALSDKSSATSLCPGASCPTAAGVSKWNDTTAAGNLSTVGFIVAGVGIAGAAVLWFTAPHRGHEPSTQVGVGPGSFQLRGSF
jgi:hypothetical protein